MDEQTERKIQEQAARQDWRKVGVGNWSEVEQAHRLRRRLVDASVYPTEGILDKPPGDSDYYEAVLRARLPAVLAELDQADLVAIYKTARLLAIVPRDGELFTYQTRASAVALALGGLDPRDFGYDVEALGVAWVLDLPQVAVKEADRAINPHGAGTNGERNGDEQPVDVVFEGVALALA